MIFIILTLFFIIFFARTVKFLAGTNIEKKTLSLREREVFLKEREFELKAQFYKRYEQQSFGLNPRLK